MATGDMTSIAARGLRLARRDPSRTTDASDALEYANEIHRAVLTDGTPWSFLEATGQVSTVAGTQRYTLSSLATQLGIANGIERINAIVDDTNGSKPLKGMHWRQLERLAHSTQDGTQGTPIAYAQVGLGTAGATVMLWPTPDASISLGILARLAVVDLAGSAFPLIPDAHAGAVMTPYIAARMWGQQSGSEAQNAAAVEDARHERALKRLVDAYGSAREEDMQFAEPGLYEHLEYPWGW